MKNIRYNYIYKTYGLTKKDFDCMLQQQNNKCAICDVDFNNKRINIDHEHCKGFTKLDPSDKKLYVRGLLCFNCNRYKVAKNDFASVKKVYNYLLEYNIKVNMNKKSTN